MSAIPMQLDRLRATPGLPAWIVTTEKQWSRNALLSLVTFEETFSDQPSASELARQCIARAAGCA